jgi:hypothetical protein
LYLKKQALEFKIPPKKEGDEKMTDAENDLHQSTQFMFKNPQSKTDYTGQQFSKQNVTCVHHAKSFTN